MFKKVFSCIVIASLFVLMSGCGGITTLSALGTVGSAAATKVIEHQAGYGIQSPHTIIERVMPAVVTVIAELPTSKRKSDAPQFLKPGERPQSHNHKKMTRVLHLERVLSYMKMELLLQTGM